MKFYDITQTLEKGMLKYPTTREFQLTFDRDYPLGSGMALSHFEMPTHIGTHLDSPYHMIEGGKRFEELEMEHFVGSVQIIEIKNKDYICADDLRNIEFQSNRLIFKTDNYNRITHGNFENVYFTPDAGEYMASKGIQFVGIDYFSVEKAGDKSRQAHKALLGNGIIILEGAFVQDVPEGLYFMMCLPLKIKDIEGAPARVLLFEYDELERMIQSKE